ncbi:hypothetical protein E2542_SST01445 [Spatholobus suberectus]|nr:hypothetical protein E2542_SST01445 [Spatholobus suberectus]
MTSFSVLASSLGLSSEVVWRWWFWPFLKLGRLVWLWRLKLEDWKRNDSTKEHDSSSNYLGYMNDSAPQNGSCSTPPQNAELPKMLGYQANSEGKPGSKTSQR